MDKTFTLALRTRRFVLDRFKRRGEADLKRIEKDTNVLLSIDEKEPKVAIAATSADDLQRAKVALERYVYDIDNSTRVNHFISLPLVDTTDLITRVENLQAGMLNMSPLPRGLNKKFMHKPTTMHMTLVTMCLVSDNHKDDLSSIKTTTQAADFLQSLKNEIQELLVKPLQVDVKGLRIMGDHVPLEKAAILYAEPTEVLVDGKARIPLLHALLQSRFKDAGFIRKEDNLKLHMTIGKTLYTKSGKGKSIRQTFDATSIMDHFRDVDFGRANCPRLEICQMGTQGQGVNGAYKSIASIALPI